MVKSDESHKVLLHIGTMKHLLRYSVWVFVATITGIIVQSNVPDAWAQQKQKPLHLKHVHDRNNSSHYPTLDLAWGDLPGYTGWSRPDQSTVAWYEVTKKHDVAVVGEPFGWMVHCRHSLCLSMEAYFDVRVYGPAILPGKVKSFHNGSYAVTVVFHDPGEYVLEIVLAFSNVASLDTFPLKTPEPAYEGYLLPGLPVAIHVLPKGINDLPSRLEHGVKERSLCTAKDLYDTDTTSALLKARWKVTTRVRGSGDVPIPAKTTSFVEYKYGNGSIGFQADYVYRDCDLSSLSFLVNQSRHLPNCDQSKLVFIGDSHMRSQHKLFLEHFGKTIPSMHIKTNDGLLTRLPEIRAALQDLKKQHQEGVLRDIYILFNAGLHEIDILCSQGRVKSRERVVSVLDGNFSCTEQYRSNLIELVQLVLDIPNTLLVFQSTSAGWLRWGNYGFAWDPNRVQLYPLAPQACADFNEIAHEIMHSHNIPIMDSFWLTRSRPDHREIDPSNSRGKKMVHSGVEIYQVLLREWLSLVFQQSSSHQSEREKN